ncbi:MAG: hypothetical protein ACXVRK_06290 [Gaiellaceae bacterium]
MKTSALDIVAETRNAIAFRINGKTTGEGRAAVVYFSPTLTRTDAVSVLRSVADDMESRRGDSPSLVAPAEDGDRA